MKKYTNAATRNEAKEAKYIDMIFGVQKKSSEEAFRRPAYGVAMKQTRNA